MSNFYCQEKSGYENFSIEKWNEDFMRRIKYNLPDTKPKICKQQCNECFDIVVRTRLKNKR